MAGQIGAQSRLLIDTAAPFDDSSVWLEFLSESITQQIPVINSAGIRGTRTHASERNRRGNETVSGTIEFEASRVLLDNILPGALGAAEDTNIFNVAESLPNLFFLIDKGFDICLVSNAKINTITFTGEQSQIVKVTIAIEAESITWGQSWPNPAPTPDVSKPYFFSDASNVTINSSGRQIFSFEVSVDNALITDQWANQLTRAGLINPSDRIVNCNLSLPGVAGNASLQNQSAIGGEQISLVLTNANEASSVITILLGRVSFNSGALVVGSKGQLVLPLTGQSRGLGHAGATAPDIRITNAHA